MDWPARLAELKPKVDQVLARHEGVALAHLQPMDNDAYISAARQMRLISSADSDAYFGISTWSPPADTADHGRAR